MLKKRLRPRSAKALLIQVTVFVACFAVGYTCWVAYRSMRMYKDVKRPQPYWKEHLHRPDPILGFGPKPGQTAETFPGGREVVMRFDDSGLRVPARGDKPEPVGRPLVLALGCSFTYGDACQAEDTYVYRVAQALNGTALNAGVCSYGLAQMLVRAREIIPDRKPEYVLMQYSPWLTERALSQFAPFYYGKLPTPFFVEVEAGQLSLHPPLFLPIAFDVPINDFHETPTSLSDKLAFLFRVGFPLFLYEDFHVARIRAISLVRPSAPAIGRGADVVRLVYGEVAALAEQSGGRLVIVMLGFEIAQPPQDELEVIAHFENAAVVDGYEALVHALPDKNGAPDEGAFFRAYGYWSGSPPQLTDRHPNPHAHDVIARAILESLGRNDASQ